jgi:Ca2+-binding RTX toxin-like protein
VIRSARTIGLVAGIAVLALGAGEASAATLPSAGGSTFDSNAQGWTSTEGSCTTSLEPAAPLCTEENQWDGSAGNPAGSLAARINVLINAGQAFKGQSTWRSPSFTAPTSSGASVLQLDRKFDITSAVSLSPQATVQPVLVDDGTKVATSLGTDNLTAGDTAFVTRRYDVAAGLLRAGRTYHLELRGSITTAAARDGITGNSALRYDNIGLFVNDAPGASGSAGVTFPGSPTSTTSFNSLASSLSLYAEVGHGPGGSLVPLSKCTIVGTAGNDRITGSRGNDVICGLGGNDVIKGGGGRDIIDGANGNDRLAGGASGDLLLGLRGRDRLDGGTGNDRLGAGAGNDRVGGRSGGDRIVGASGNDRLGGDSGNDRIYGVNGRDVLAGKAGNDRLSGGRDSDRISGGAGRDRIAARDHSRDRVDGGSGRDRAVVDRAAGGSRRHHYYSRADKVRRVERMG